MSSGFLDQLARALHEMFAPLRDALEHPDTFGALLLQHGWAPPEDREQIDTVRARFELGADIEAALTSTRVLLEEGGYDPTSIADAVARVAVMAKKLHALESSSTAGLIWPFDQSAFWAEFPRDLLSHLFANYLYTTKPALHALLHLFGIVDRDLVDPTDPKRPVFHRTRLRWERIFQLLLRPETLFREVYGFGASFDHAKLLERLEYSARAFHLTARRSVPYRLGATSQRPEARELFIRLMRDVLADQTIVECGLAIAPIPPKGAPDAAPNGIAVGPWVSGSLGTDISLGGPFTLQLRGAADRVPFVVEIRPDELDARVPPGVANVDFGATLAISPGAPWILIGSEDSHRLALHDASVALIATGTAADPELIFRAGSTRLEAVLDFSDGDGFLNKIFGDEPHVFQLGGAIAWSSKRGLSFEGGAGLSLSIPANLRIGPATISGLTLALEADADRARLALLASAALEVGPLEIGVDRVGIAFEAVRGDGGALPGIQLDFAFAPPAGLLLGLDLGAVSGRGAVLYDRPGERYLGALSLEVRGLLSIDLAALLETTLPGDANGWSMLISGSVAFPPIQIGFGFELRRAGAMLGIHRRVDLDALEAALFAGDLPRLLSPPRAEADLSRAFEPLARVFPAAEGRYVLGVMFGIDWGHPKIVSIELGFIYDTSAPSRLVVLGALEALWPRDEPLVELHLDLAGIFEVDPLRIDVRAHLRDSFIAGLVLKGDAALLFDTGDPPLFVLSIGGFHPDFTPPLGFPRLQRLEVAFPENDFLDLSLTAYLALTSNTIQFGASLDFYAGISGVIGARGHVSFDALVRFHPFEFEASLDVWVAIEAAGTKLFGARLYGTLSGPGRWCVEGGVYVEVLWWEVKIYDVDRCFGDRPEPRALPPVDVERELREILLSPKSWRSETPQYAAYLSFGTVEGQTGLVINPLGELAVSQSLVPLGVEIDRLGASPVAGARRFTIDKVRAGGAERPVTPKLELFAPGQYFDLDLDDKGKLSQPSFEKMRAGVEFELDAGGADPTAFAITTAVEYETIPAPPSGPFRPREDVLAEMLASEVAPPVRRVRVLPEVPR